MRKVFERECVECGKRFLSNRSHGKYCCEECRAAGKRKKGREAFHKYYERQKAAGQSEKEKNRMRSLNLAEINALARKEGLSYGQYMARHGL